MIGCTAALGGVTVSFGLRRSRDDDSVGMAVSKSLRPGEHLDADGHRSWGGPQRMDILGYHASDQRRTGLGSWRMRAAVTVCRSSVVDCHRAAAVLVLSDFRPGRWSAQAARVEDRRRRARELLTGLPRPGVRGGGLGRGRFGTPGRAASGHDGAC
jgi:hypothetical protein